MSGDTLVLFGNNNLQKSWITTSFDGSRAATGQEVQTLDVAREPGVSVINTKYEPKVIRISGRVEAAAGSGPANLQKAIEEFDVYLNKTPATARYLRFVPEYTEHPATNTTTGWTGSDDAANLTTTTTNFQTGSSGLKFDIDVSASGNNFATLTYTESESVDLSSVSDTGNFELSLYLPDTSQIETIDFRIGNDSSNYYGRTIGSNYEGLLFENGWNLLSSDWSTITETGTVDDSDIDYIYVRINYSSDAVDINDCVLDGVMWVNEDRLRNFPSFRLGELTREGNHYNNTFSSWKGEFLNATGWAESTHTYELFPSTNVTTVNNTQTFNIDGSLPARPVIDLVINDATNVDKVTISNNVDNTAVEIVPNSVANGDTIVFDRLNTSVTQNGSNVKVNGVLPTYPSGINSATLAVQQAGATVISQEVNTNLLSGSITSNTYRAQQFLTPANAGTLTTAEILCTHDGVLFQTFNFVAFIYSDNGSDQPGTQVSPSFGGKGTQVTKGLVPQYNAFNFNFVYTINTKYWLVVRIPDDVDTNNLQWANNTAGGYADGIRAVSDDLSAWTTTSGEDHAFRITFEPSVSYDIDWSGKYKKLYSA